MEKSNNKIPEAPEDFYLILGVEKTATEQEIKNAYRKLALEYHPDRNFGDEKAQEKFKKISIAYSVLSDPNKRRQYNLMGPNELNELESLNIAELGNFGRFVGAVFSKLGASFPTQIIPKVLAKASDLSTGKSKDAQLLKPGITIFDSVNSQEANFYRICMEEKYEKFGALIRCKSASSNKFKLVLFDKNGYVRLIRESEKKKYGTTAEFFFVPFQLIHIGEFNKFKFLIDKKQTPFELHTLDATETIAAHTLEIREHILCVYGDNFFNSVKYKITFYPLTENENLQNNIKLITEIEPKLLIKKSEMSKFQVEYLDLKKRFEAANARLKREDEEITKMLKDRYNEYEKFYENCSLCYTDIVPELNNQKSSSSFFTSLFGSSSSSNTNE